MSRGKREDARSKSRTVGKPGISKQIGQERRKVEYEARTARKNKSGGIIDKRFGESNKEMTNEEKMLERFTKERLAHASKYSLADDEDSDNDTLTHSGHSLSGKVQKDEGDEGEFFSKKREIDENETPPDQPARKKTKAEVMKEVIAKSKYYKHLRQEEHAKLQHQVSELDENFNDVMTDLKDTTKKATPTSKEEKTGIDIAYDKKVKQVQLSGRAAPADRTKTAEEIAQEKKENLERLENQRLRRMQGELENQEEHADDLDDEFWAGSDEDVANGLAVNAEDAPVSAEDLTDTTLGDSSATITIGGKVIRFGSTDTGLICPQKLDEFLGLVGDKSYEEVIPLIKQVFKKYQPKLREGNKEKIGVFIGVLIDYILKLEDDGCKEANKSQYIHLMEFSIKLIRDLSEKFPEKLLDHFRTHLQSAQDRIESRDHHKYPLRSDLVLYTMVGRSFSTSDMYHLIVTPALVLLGESLEFMKIDKHITDLFAGIYICDLLIQYERIAKRIVPEVINFLERVLLTLVQDPDKILHSEKLATCVKQPTRTKFTLSIETELPADLQTLSLSNWMDVSQSQCASLLLKTVSLLDQYVSLFIETSSFIEISTPFVVLLRHMVVYHASTPLIPSLLKKIENIRRIASNEREPLQLQSHRPLSIPTYAPKFEENYNPDRKFYDPDRTRQEVGKLQHQIKEEKKQNMRELRRQTEFEARAHINEKKEEYKKYHEKMAKIVNSIQTQEGTAKNEYEREKRRRK
ncbi:hypothetical protein FOA43_002046 [Brettanomyces nanus]|uniref:Nucleolar protein 14 n=1 Tax=Eeniella nana TaxID=13502 RepID=A0A875S1C0_EENNA|nr:uncharacterized protein FOA43_002046 [Brettanomyces nanus]QPG74713.1 hypothetical protein FOA43_002046 [Brettanomyces nanus]